jgi:hypothetical protein
VSIGRMTFTNLIVAAASLAATVHADELTKQEFVRFATELSQDYAMPGRSHSSQPNRDVLEAIGKSPSPQLQRAARTMLEELNRERDLLSDKKKLKENLKAYYSDMLRRAERGEFVTRESRYDIDPLGKSMPVTQTQDESQAAIQQAKAGLNAIANMSDEQLAEAARREAPPMIRQKYHDFRLKAWADLVPIARKLAGPKSAQPLVAMSQEKDSFRLRNGNRELTGATVVVEFVHHSTCKAKATTTFSHFYYIPTWKPNQAIELSKQFVPNSLQTSLVWFEPTIFSDGKPAGKPETQRDLSRMGGVIQTKVRVYANEAFGDTVETAHPEAAIAVADQRLKGIEKYVTSKSANHKVLEKMYQYDFEPLMPLLPTDCEQAKLIKRYFSNPEAFQGELSAALDDEFLKLFAPGQRYEGNFVTRNNNGSAGLIFTSFKKDGKEVQAELYDPKKHDTRRMFAGSVLDDPVSKRKMLVMTAMAPTENPPAAPAVQAIGISVFDSSVKTITVRFNTLPSSRSDDPKHMWKATTQSPQFAVFDNNPIGLAFEPVKPDPQQLADAQKRLKEKSNLKIPTVNSLAPATRPPAQKPKPR